MVEKVSYYVTISKLLRLYVLKSKKKGENERNKRSKKKKGMKKENEKH